MSKKENSVDFTVLMIGQRRTGKSSMLAAMLNSMDKIKEETGLVFRADESTQVLMRTKLSHLEKIFALYERNEIFSTMSGNKNGESYGEESNEMLFYRFYLGLKNGKKKDYIIEFVDIRGEDMLSDMEVEGATIKDYVAKAQMIMIAVDAPALMEGTWKKGYSEVHDRVNVPASIYDCISTADVLMRQQQEASGNKKELPDKLILFVPIKCEKYYYEQTMGKLNEALKAGYKNTLTFLSQRKEYTIAITPILTLGDVVFDHYQTKILKSGKEVIDTFGDEASESMRTIPKAPLFRFRDVKMPRFSPQYCEQPLLYFLAYALSVTGKMEAFKKTENPKGIKNVLKFAKFALNVWLFGAFYLAYLGISTLMKDKAFIEQARKVVYKLKLSGDGYEIVQDNLKLTDIVNQQTALTTGS